MKDVFRILKLGAALLLTALWMAGARSARAGEPPAGTKPETQTPAKPNTPAEPKTRTVALSVTDKGFEPSPLSLKKGEPVLLRITRKSDRTCGTEIVIEGTDINVPLPLNQTVEVRFTPKKSGVLKYGCAMDMMVSGVFLVE